VSTKRLTVEISNSKSRIPTACWTLTSGLPYISMESSLVGVLYALGRTVAFQGSENPPPQSFHSNFRSWKLLVRSPSILLTACCSSFGTEDPDLENAPVVPDMGTIELRAFRCRVLRAKKYRSKEKSGLHRGRVSERSKMAGWHHVRYYISRATRPILIQV
jgi:hypothetical protein